MAFRFEDETPQGGRFRFEDEPTPTEQPAPTAAVGMSEVGSRKLPANWVATVHVDGRPMQVRGWLDNSSGREAYVVPGQKGESYYITRGENGTLGLKPYKHATSAKGTDGENFLAGVGKAAVDTGRGLRQLGTLAGNTLGIVDNETVDRTMADAGANRELDAELMDTKAGIGGNIAGTVGTAVLGGAALKGAGHGLGHVGKVMSASGRAPAAGTAVSYAGNSLTKAGQALITPKTYGQAGAAGATMGAMQPATSLEDKALQVGLGGAAGVVGQGVANAVGSAARGASESIRQEVKDLAKLAREKWGIVVGNDKLVKSKAADAVASAVDYIPLSGAGKATANRQKQFNLAIAKTIGQTSDNPAFAIKEADKALGAEFDRVLSTNSVKADDVLQNELAQVIGDARNEMTDQQFGVIQRQLDNILGKVSAGDLIDAQAAYNIKKGLDRLGKSSDTTLAHYADEMKSVLMSALHRSLPPDEAAKFAATRAQYSNLINLRKVVPRGAEADISPAKLANLRGYMTDDLNELADIAATFLKPREGNSGTAPRLAGMAALGGGAPTALLVPGAALPMAAGAGVTMAAGRAANKLLNSPRVGEYLMEGSKTLRKVEPVTRAAPLALPAFLESYLTSQ